MTDASDRFASTAAYYAAYRPGYPEAAVEDVAARFDLDTDARLLDLGCGTGQLALPFAAHAGAVIAMDPSREMLERGRKRASDAGIEAITWVEGADADLDRSVAPLRLTTIGRAFHWMDRERTLSRLHELTEPGGGVALFGDTEWVTRGTAAWQDAVYDAASEFVTDLPERTGPVTYEKAWADVLAASPFENVETRRYERKRSWTTAEVVGYALSLSFCSPAAVGNVAAFERAVRERLSAYGEEPYVETATCETNTARRR